MRKLRQGEVRWVQETVLEKIRTYNFPQGRVTDHRIKYTSHRLNEILNGDLDEIIDQLTSADQAAKLAKLND